MPESDSLPLIFNISAAIFCSFVNTKTEPRSEGTVRNAQRKAILNLCRSSRLWCWSFPWKFSKASFLRQNYPSKNGTALCITQMLNTRFAYKFCQWAIDKGLCWLISPSINLQQNIKYRWMEEWHLWPLRSRRWRESRPLHHQKLPKNQLLLEYVELQFIYGLIAQVSKNTC